MPPLFTISFCGFRKMVPENSGNSCRVSQGASSRNLIKRLDVVWGWFWGTSPPSPLGFIALGPIRQGGMKRNGRAEVRPAVAVLAPGPALGSRPRVALSSVQAARRLPEYLELPSPPPVADLVEFRNAISRPVRGRGRLDSGCGFSRNGRRVRCECRVRGCGRGWPRPGACRGGRRPIPARACWW